MLQTHRRVLGTARRELTIDECIDRIGSLQRDGRKSTHRELMRIIMRKDMPPEHIRAALEKARCPVCKDPYCIAHRQ